MRARGKDHIDTLVLMIGGNDAGFGQQIATCLGAGVKEVLSYGIISDTCSRGSNFERQIQRGLQRLPDAYANLNRAIRARLKPKKILLVRYPDPLNTRRGLCGNVNDNGPQPPLGVSRLAYRAFGSMDRNSVRRIQAEFIQPLLTAMATAARTHSWTLVSGWDRAVQNGGYCAQGTERMFNVPSDTHRDQGDVSGLFHPNARGYAVLAPLTQRALAGAEETYLAQQRARAKRAAKAKALDRAAARKQPALPVGSRTTASPQKPKRPQ